VAADSLLIPTFSSTLTGLATILREGELWGPLVESHKALVLGFLLSLAIGIPVGFLMARFRAAERITDVYLNILLVVPTGAIIPLLIMWLGITLTARVVVVVVFTVVMVVVNVRAGVRQVDPGLIQMLRSFGASEREIWTKALLPGAAPGIMAAVRIGLSRAIQGTVIVELLLVPVGIGGLIQQFKGLYRADLMYATVFVVVAEALLLVYLAGRLERRVLRWVQTRAPVR
jgi:NitT/TauT family transport system permease protein